MKSIILTPIFLISFLTFCPGFFIGSTEIGSLCHQYSLNGQKPVLAPVAILPEGPIFYYNQYETPNSITLSTVYTSGNQWYKNGVAIPGATGNSLTVQFQGLQSYTDYYTVTHDVRTSNQVEFNYIGCDEPGDYPASVPSTSYCASSLASGVPLDAPSLGTGTTYSWWLQTTPTCYSISNTGLLTASGCSSYPSNGVYTLSALEYFDQIYMYYVFTVNSGCKVKSSATSTMAKKKTNLSPKPTIPLVKTHDPR